MKQFLCFALLAVCFFGASAHDGDKMINDCKNQHNISESEAHALFESYTVPSSNTGKCFLGCVMKATNIMSEDNKINKAQCLKIANKLFQGDAAKLKKATDAVNTCTDNLKTTDSCETSAAFLGCWTMNGPQIAKTLQKN